MLQRARTLSLTLTLIAATACASSRAPGSGDDDDVTADAAGAGTDAAIEADAGTGTETDAAADDDASTVASCDPVALETVASWQKLAGAFVTAPSIAVSPSGEIVAAYNLDTGPVMLSTRGPNGVWTAAPIDDQLGSWPAIAFAPDGTLHACYVGARSDAQGPLICRSRPPGGAWSNPTTVDANASRLPSVAIDPYGRLNVGYARAEGPAVASQSSGGGWSTYVMAVGTAEAAALAYGPPGSEQLVWTMWSAGYPSLFERTTGFVDGTFATLRPRSLAIDGTGRVHVAFARYRDEQLSYAYRDADNVWHFEHDLDGAGLISPWTMALALDAAGNVHVTFHARATASQPERVLHAARSPSGAWTTETLLAPTAGIGTVTAIAADAGGHVHIAFDGVREEGGNTLRTVYYARRCESVDPL